MEEQSSVQGEPGGSERTGGGAPRRRMRVRETRCRFCRERTKRVDYKDLLTLQALVRGQGRLASGRRSGNCARCQRMVKRAVKQARFMALLAYTESPKQAGRLGSSW